MDRPPTPAQQDAARKTLVAWLQTTLRDNPVVDGAGPDTEEPERRWYLRVRGEDKDVFTIWFTLDQRTLAYESYVLAAPEENQAAVYEQLLRRNRGLYGPSFSIGSEDAIFLTGRMDLDHVDDESLDHLLGTIYATVEQSFRALLRLGFATRLAAAERGSG
ncbi:MAG: YbjN domain-containing protein [Acidimicrobiia bacterium]|nr:YbjN domain-containing protein [Acidimicrobiia bacterium]MDH5236062.1 YbjN domain-containing protein [Acidimicrobiia bacterium]